MTEDLHHCENDCAAPPTFPVRPNNAPALDRIRYRIGDYHSIREALLYGINRAGPLQHWTHRLPDDPGIALLEGTAIVGDILTFYQEHYANEVWLRTARWRESITELVRLLGYRLSPALAGRGTFALEIKGKTAITVPAHFPLKADLAEMPAPVDFETSMEIIAHPHLSKFHLYPPRVYAPKIAAHTTRFEIASVGTDTSPEAFAAVNLKKGDLIMLVPGSGQPLAQTVKIAAITPLLDRVIIDIEGGFVADWSGTVRAWRLGRTFKHQGHQAPETVVQTHTHSDGTIHVFTTPRDFLQEFTNTVWLDTEVKDLAAGTDLIIEITNFGFSALNVARTITSARASTATNVGFTSPALRVQLNEALPLNRISGAGGGATTISSGLKFVGTPYIDVRDFRFHETTSPALTLRPVATFTPTWPTVPKLEFQGNEAQASVLKNRRILLRKPGVEALERTVVNVDPVPGIPRRWALTFNEPLAPRLLARFARSLSILIHKPFLAALSSVTGKLPVHQAPLSLQPSDFDEAMPTVNVFGNIVDADQGHSEPETALGHGDANAIFQTFKLPKSPLTYLIEAGATPAEVPELEVFVAGMKWQRVDSFFAQPAAAEIYIVREDINAESYIQFGDGINGACLPSGLNNISARWRRGVGAHGALKPGAEPKGAARLDGLDTVQLPGVITGGSEREHELKAKLAAPGRVQGLGRIVSLQDYETEVLGIPGIVAATAQWDAPYGTPAVVLRVLLASGREQEAEAIKAAVMQFQRQRGPNRHPLLVLPCTFKAVSLALTCSLDPRVRRADAESAIRAALETKIFALHQRRIGQREYRDRVEGTVQNVPGITWCELRSANLDCGSEQMLRLEAITFIHIA